MHRSLNGLVLTATIAIVAAGCPKKEEKPPPTPPEPATATVEVAKPLVAKAALSPRSDTKASGEITFTQDGDTVAIVADIANAPAGAHGLHVHEVGDCGAPDFKSAGGHFNPTGAIHGAPTDAEHHAGDLGNIEVGADGTAHLETTSSLVTVEEGPSSVVGRAVILHELADDFVTQPTGAAGSRIACGVVELDGVLAKVVAVMEDVPPAAEQKNE